jgi:hypothetical protein
MESTRSVDKQHCIIPVELSSRFKNRPFCFKGSKYELSDLDAPALLAGSQSRGRIRFPAAVYFLCPFYFFHGHST